MGEKSISKRQKKLMVVKFSKKASNSVGLKNKVRIDLKKEGGKTIVGGKLDAKKEGLYVTYNTLFVNGSVNIFIHHQ